VISIILGVYIKALCRHPQRPDRAEGVPLHDAEGLAHNGVYVKAFCHGRQNVAPGYHLCVEKPFRSPGAAAAQVCGAVRAGKTRVEESPAAERFTDAGWVWSRDQSMHGRVWSEWSKEAK